VKLLLATTSEHKVNEIRLILCGLGLDLLSLDQIAPVAAPLEIGSTFEENARLKASVYREATGYPSLADDSGLEVDALGGSPGVFSSRFAPTDAERIARVLRKLEHLSGSADRSRRRARFVCSVCLDWGGSVTRATGTVEGEIALEPSGCSGFGYDPIFYYPPLGKTFGEMSEGEKNQISHRARALHKLRAELVRVRIAGSRLPGGGPDPEDR